MLDTHLLDLGNVDRDKRTACIKECVDCAQMCTACASLVAAVGSPEPPLRASMAEGSAK
jgi:hypothetical protein